MKSSLVVYLILIAILSGCAKRSPKYDRSAPMLQQAALELQAGNNARALQLVNDAIKINPTEQAKAMRANIYYYQQQFALAAREFLRLTGSKKINPIMRTDLLNNAASALFRSGEQQRAIDIWQDLTVSQHYSTPEVAWMNLGLAELNLAHSTLNRTEHLKKALPMFDRAIQIAPDYIDAVWYMACVYHELGDTARARMALEALLMRAPDHQGAVRLLAALPTSSAAVAA